MDCPTAFQAKRRGFEPGVLFYISGFVYEIYFEVYNELGAEGNRCEGTCTHLKINLSVCVMFATRTGPT